MSPLDPRRESEDRALALALATLDPLCSIVAGIWVGRYASLAIQSRLTHGGGYSVAQVIFFIGFAIVVGNLMALVAPLAPGFGAPPQAFLNARGNAVAFWTGIVLIGTSYVPAALLFIAQSIPFFDDLGTALLSVTTFFLIVTGCRRIGPALLTSARSASAQLRVRAKNRRQNALLSGQIVLCGGVAGGVFRDRKLAVGAPAKGELLLSGEQSVRRGTIVIGAPGSSKTRSKIYPDLYWGLQTSPRAGALVFVTKKRATQDCYRIARTLRPAERIHVVGIGQQRETMDIAAGMTHESIGDAIQDGLGSSHSDFWRHGPSAFVEGFLEVIHAIAPTTVLVPALEDDDGTVQPGNEAYELSVDDTLPSLLRLISLDVRRLDAVFSYGFARVNELEASAPERAAVLRGLLHEVKGRIVPLMQRDAKLGEEFRQSVLPQLQPFARGTLRDAFCNRKGTDLSLLEHGHVILIEIDETEHPRAVATVVRMIFRRLVQMARERTSSNRVGSLDPILLICDEYTNYAASGHVQAWNTVRESNLCATVGITGVSALTKQLGGDQNAANAIVANFANKFFFENDDKATRDLARELIGQTTMVRHGTTEGTSRSHGSSSNASLSGGSHHSRGTSRSKTSSEHREDALDGEIWRSLRADRAFAKAIAFVRTEDGVATDVVTLGVLDPAEHVVTALPEGYGMGQRYVNSRP